LSQVALAQCVDSQLVSLDSRPEIELATKGKPRTGELITTAAAGTHDASPLPRAVAAADEEESHRHGGTAMLLAALALMSGIALRRYGANDQ
jgi:hypothetical protein